MSSPLLAAQSSSFLWKSGALLAASGIICGAFGSHGLRQRADITPENISSWMVASNYAIFNGLALLAVSMHPRFSAHRFAGPAILSGAIIFSGSILALVAGKPHFRFLGPVTPLGGTALIAGYIALAL